MTTQKKTNPTAGALAALGFLILAGIFVGLPVIVWLFLVAGVIGVWVARFYSTERSTESRPWQHH